MKRLLLLVFLLLPSGSLAADFGCGRDTDRNGSVDNMCPGSDADADGETVASGDCNDDDFSIFKGVTVGGDQAIANGCASGEYRTCKVDGTGWSACVATGTTPFCPNSATYTTDTGAVALACYYFATTGNDSTGDGSYGNPWATPGKISQGFSSGHTPIAGDAFIFLGGTYSTEYSSGGNRLLYVTNKTGTATNKIWLMSYPGQTAVLDPTTAIQPINITGAQHWIMRGIEATGGYETAVSFGTGSAQVSNIRLSLNHIHDEDGNGGANNHSCLAFGDGCTAIEFDHNDTHDCYNSVAPTNPNNSNILFFKSTDTLVHHNNGIQNDGYGYYLKLKHASDTGSSYGVEADWNYVKNTYYAAFGSSGAMAIRNNLIADVYQDYHALQHSNLGGESYTGPFLVLNNTIVGSLFLGMGPHREYSGGTPAADACSGRAMDAITVEENIVTDDRASYAQDWRFIGVSTYGPDSLRTNFLSVFSIGSNGYYNGTATLSWGLYESNNGNLTCSGRGNDGQNYTFAQWQAAGFDSGSVVADPNFDAKYLPATVSMTSWGYLGNVVTTTTSTTVTTTTDPGLNTSFNNAPQKNSLFRRFFKK